MSYDYVNAMEELAKASLMVRDLADGILGTVIIEANACVILTEEDKASHEAALAEIHQGQLDMAERGWHRAPDFITKHMWKKNHNVERAAWFFNDHEKQETRWILCTLTTRFGLRAVFTNEEDLGARTIKGDELRAIIESELERHSRFETSEE